MADPLWEIERSLWLDGVDAWRRQLGKGCIMAFAPTGAMQDEQIIESLRDAPRWQSVEISDTVLTRPTDNTAILAYHAVARRGDNTPYWALCTSTYVATGGDWKIVQHQQTPL